MLRLLQKEHTCRSITIVHEQHRRQVRQQACNTQTPPCHLPQRGTASQCLAHIFCSQMARWIKMALGRKVGLDPSDSVLDGDPAPLPKRGQSPQFVAYVYCGQTAAWIKMPLGMDVGVDPGHIALDGDSAPPPQKGGTAPHFRSMYIVPKRPGGSRRPLVRSNPRLRPHCVTWGPSSPSQKGHSPQFSARVYCGQTVTHLSYC